MALEADRKLVAVRVAGDLEEFERQFPRRVMVQGKRASLAPVLTDICAMLERDQVVDAALIEEGDELVMTVRCWPAPQFVNVRLMAVQPRG